MRYSHQITVRMFTKLGIRAASEAQGRGLAANATSARRRGHLVRYDYPESRFEADPVLDVGEATLARLHGLSRGGLRALRQAYAHDVERTARELLAVDAVRAALDRLPLAPGSTILAIGDSITADRWSWAQLLRALLGTARHRPEVAVDAVAHGGATTADALVALDAHRPPFHHAVVLLGSNDCVRCATADVPRVSDAESERNLAAIDATVRARTGRGAIFLVPPPIDAARIAADWYLGPHDPGRPASWLAAKQALVRALPRCLVDCDELFGHEAPADLFADGLHPDLPAQATIVRALVEAWAAESEELR